MKRFLARAATLALAAPLAAGLPAGGAAALEPISTTVDGCYGAGPSWAIVCDLTLTLHTPEPAFTTTYVPVCVTACYDVPVNTVDTSSSAGPTRLCYSFTDKAGYEYSGCHDDAYRYLEIQPLDISRLVNCATLGLCPATED
jgi:hypothetical protein